MSADRSFEENFLREGNEVLKQIVPKMIQIWRQMGFPASKNQERFSTAISHHKELWESMLEEEQNNKKRVVSTIDRLGRQHHQLCKELGSRYKEFDEDIPLLEMERILQESLSALNREKEERMKSVRALFVEEDQLCRRLGTNPSSINREKIPTSDQFNMLQEHIRKLKLDIVTRQGQFVAQRDSIRNMMQQLETSARSALEVELLVSEPQSVSLSDEFMKSVQELQEKLQFQIEHNRTKAADLRSSIETLWERLDIESEVRDMFLAENRGSAPSTIQSLEREKARLEELKRHNIERFIRAVRQDLVGWWDRCYVSDADRHRFSPFYSEVFTEDVLEMHEAQVEKYKNLHNTYKEIFLKVHHRENLWKRMEDIEARGKDPARLFGNRGCALLLEEKERKQIIKELPRVEEKLTELFNSYERTHGEPLLINGRDYRQKVSSQWAEHEEHKENEKLQRQKDRAEKLVEEAKGGAKPTTPIKRRLGTTALRTHLESPKAKQRKLLAPSTAPQQRPGRRILTEAMVNQLPQSIPNEPHESSMMSTYSAFTERLLKKDCMNSTAVFMESNRGTPSSSRGPSTLPRRRSPRLASTPSTPINSHSMLRRSKTQSIMAPPMSVGRLTPARSTPKLTMTKHPRPFLI